MNIDIRSYIKTNFNNSTKSDIKKSVEEAIKKGDDITLPGLGFFFEIIWNTSDEDNKNKILNTLESYFK
ncbi:MAG: small acid-soluble spore protein SspI [Bacilli bacterium]|nr:small acid-soluble spore protein SspI [Bacilli bacterium]MDD3304724.1 small acid-soluble spore protein SspI [Bacilli bacterium]MDD4053597.1 small acid-soluble spore protein SspI [Bacilli bacterium]MDD4411096.1 small acid-soluble spore protein SspI [Bacilli bacterium]